MGASLGLGIEIPVVISSLGIGVSLAVAVLSRCCPPDSGAAASRLPLREVMAGAVEEAPFAASGCVGGRYAVRNFRGASRAASGKLLYLAGDALCGLIAGAILIIPPPFRTCSPWGWNACTGRCPE